MTHVAAARVFGVTRHTVDAWVKKRRKGGAKTLCARRRGRPPGQRLDYKQRQRVIRTILGRYPEQLRLPCCLWTRAAVGEVVERFYGIKLSVWTVGRYLADWGFTPQKPLRRAYEQNPEAVYRWLKDEYPAIRRAARRVGAEIHWIDQMGLRSDYQAGRSYGLKGVTPVIPGTGQRFGCSLMSSITNLGSLRFMVYRKKFNGKLFIEFLRRLTRDVHRPVYAIADQHKVHTSAKVEDWLRQHAQQIRLFFLPTYSPELNPDEMVNNDVKSEVLGRNRPRNAKELVRKVRSSLQSRQKRPSYVRKYFKERTVSYAAA